MIWRQSRDISVCNYPHHMVYEIFTNQGTLRIVENKTTKQVEVLKEPPTKPPRLAECSPV
jgi:hypothetical protein